MFQYCSAVGYDDDVFMKQCMDYEVEGVWNLGVDRREPGRRKLRQM